MVTGLSHITTTENASIHSILIVCDWNDIFVCLSIKVPFIHIAPVQLKSVDRQKADELSHSTNDTLTLQSFDYPDTKCYVQIKRHDQWCHAWLIGSSFHPHPTRAWTRLVCPNTPMYFFLNVPIIVAIKNEWWKRETYDLNQWCNRFVGIKPNNKMGEVHNSLLVKGITDVYT